MTIMRSTFEIMAALVVTPLIFFGQNYFNDKGSDKERNVVFTSSILAQESIFGPIESFSSVANPRNFLVKDIKTSDPDADFEDIIISYDKFIYGMKHFANAEDDNNNCPIPFSFSLDSGEGLFHIDWEKSILISSIKTFRQRFSLDTLNYCANLYQKSAATEIVNQISWSKELTGDISK